MKFRTRWNASLPSSWRFYIHRPCHSDRLPITSSRVHSVAFQIGSFTIYWYGILAAVAFLVAFLTAMQRAPREGMTKEAIADLAPWLIAGAILGARLNYVIAYWNEEFAGKPISEVFMLRRSGLVWYGGLIGASLATILYARIQKHPLWKIADIIAPSIALGHVFGRFGCLMTGCCYGRPTELPWAIHFPHDHPTHGVGVHPTQIYESGLNFLLFLGLCWLYRRKKFDGQIFGTYLVSYALLRSFVEIFRGDYTVVHYVGGLASPGQTVSIVIFVVGCILLWKLGHARSTFRDGSISPRPRT